MDIKKLGIIDSSEACKILNISNPALHFYVKKYKIPHISFSNAKVFLKSDIETFQEGRKDRLKHRKDKKRGEFPTNAEK